MPKHSELGRNDPCWCGSGSKYKKCHLDRHLQQPLALQEWVAGHREAFSDKYCLAAVSSDKPCEGKIIRAHTIQRSGGLNRIALDGQVYGFKLPLSIIIFHPDIDIPKLEHVNHASTITGFCTHHDNEIFAPIEKSGFTISQHHCFLLAYRALSYELFAKQGAKRFAQFQRKGDKGWDLEKQKAWQNQLDHLLQGMDIALSELRKHKASMDRILNGQSFGDVKYYALELACVPTVLCSAMIQPDLDFDGNLLQDYGNLDVPLEYITFTILPTKTGGVVVFSWTGEQTACLQFVQSLNKFSDARITDAVLRYVFESFENTYASPQWWDSLSTSKRTILIRRMRHSVVTRQEDPRALVEDGIEMANWGVKARLTNL